MEQLIMLIGSVIGFMWATQWTNGPFIHWFRELVLIILSYIFVALFLIAFIDATVKFFR